MSSTTAARRDGTTDAATSRYSNPIGWFLCVLAAIVAPTVILIASPVFGLVRYWGWSGALVLAAFGGSCVLAVMSISVFVSVGIQPGRVVLRGLLHSTIVTSGEVETIRLDPPVHTLRMAWGFGRRWSVFTINRKGKAPIEASPMPDGLKLRIANALRPEDFPLPDE